MGPEFLDEILKSLPVKKDPRVLVGLETSDDAGVYQLSEELALVQTVDFFTPIVDNPFQFGQIAVVNALSDIYAMGGKPLVAMNLVAFPVKSIDSSVLVQILLGGLSKLDEAGVALVGGHSVEDPEIKYGLSVTGMIHPAKVLKNAGARPGDKLILTKPLGTGIISTALKAGIASQEAVDKIVRAMTALNKRASEVMLEEGANACTDITGFGLIGHALEMAKASGVGITIDTQAIPIFSEAIEYARMGLVPGGAYSNRKFFSCRVDASPRIDSLLVDILYDPQTSGGLLISLQAEKAERLVSRLRQELGEGSGIIGEVTPEPPGRIRLI